ncbi:MAG: hypothetical protein SFY67_09200 [Candidatus Melainabacteria bacterium]|nr:hypothetical protein [Candidatus Melainabacteria bacterium]
MSSERFAHDQFGCANDVVLALTKFESKFADEQTCMNYVLHKLAKEVRCKECQGGNVRRLARSRDCICNDCGTISSLTAGTIFNGVRKIGPYLKMIWLLERGLAFNCFQIHKHLGIAYSTCLAIFKKLSTVIKDLMENREKKIGSALFMPIFMKRSRLTPLNEHPQAEQKMAYLKVTVKDEFNKSSEDVELKLGSLSDFDRKVYELIRVGKIDLDNILQKLEATVHDVMLPLFELEDAGLIERLPANYFALKDNSNSHLHQNLDAQPYSHKLKKHVSKCLLFLREKFRGISRKYLQNYLAVFWCWTDRKTWGPNSLLRACLRSPEISYHQILTYETPLDVNFIFGGDK